jgi:transposase
MLRTIEALREQIRTYDRVIDELAARYAATQVLRQITGVGALTAVTYVLTLGDPSRFGRSRQIGAYLGLVPRQHDSGNHVSQLPITKAGDTLLRRLLVSSAHYYPRRARARLRFTAVRRALDGTRRKECEETCARCRCA